MKLVHLPLLAINIDLLQHLLFGLVSVYASVKNYIFTKF